MSGRLTATVLTIQSSSNATLSGAPASGLVERDSCIALMFAGRRGPRLPAVGLVFSRHHIRTVTGMAPVMCRLADSASWSGSHWAWTRTGNPDNVAVSCRKATCKEESVHDVMDHHDRGFEGLA